MELRWGPGIFLSNTDESEQPSTTRLPALKREYLFLVTT